MSRYLSRKWLPIGGILVLGALTTLFALLVLNLSSTASAAEGRPGVPPEIDTLESKLDALETKVDKLERKIDEILQVTNLTNEDLEELAENLAEDHGRQEDQHQEIGQDIDKLEAKVDTIQAPVGD